MSEDDYTHRWKWENEEYIKARREWLLSENEKWFSSVPRVQLINLDVELDKLLCSKFKRNTNNQ